MTPSFRGAGEAPEPGIHGHEPGDFAEGVRHVVMDSGFPRDARAPE